MQEKWMLRLSPWDVPHQVWVLGFTQEGIQERATAEERQIGLERYTPHRAQSKRKATRLKVGTHSTDRVWAVSEEGERCAGTVLLVFMGLKLAVSHPVTFCGQPQDCHGACGRPCKPALQRLLSPGLRPTAAVNCLREASRWAQCSRPVFCVKRALYHEASEVDFHVVPSPSLLVATDLCFELVQDAGPLHQQQKAFTFSRVSGTLPRS
ncbi:hypothetical protein Cadr_000029073 [Camelus dromedarius]|uniref:Uncharacterized protein n=1 Tax=Camelus dromedarius TaxID=9838 RepID=A0A5N4C7I9_CAMDR|nr:hypothetical protein Cadr_000029073 [Camelus dromedarius]